MACLSVEPSECFYTLRARGPAAQWEGLHRCCALGRAQGLLSSIFPCLPRSILCIRLPTATPAALRLPPRIGSMHLTPSPAQLQDRSQAGEGLQATWKAPVHLCLPAYEQLVNRVDQGVLQRMLSMFGMPWHQH